MFLTKSLLKCPNSTKPLLSWKLSGCAPGQNSLFSLFWPIQRHWAISSHVQAYWGTLKDIWAYLGIIEAYGGIIKNFWNSTKSLCIQPCHIQNPGFFRTLGIFKILLNMLDDHAYLELWHSQNCLFQRFQGYFGIFRDIDGNSATLFMCWTRETSAALFENRKKYLVCWKEGPDYEVPLSKGPSSTTPLSPLPFAKHSILNVWHCSYSVLCRHS